MDRLGMDKGGRERGSIPFYALLIFPFLWAVSTIVLDLPRIEAEKLSLQQNADRIALTAAKEYPDANRAIDKARLLLNDLTQTTGIAGSVTPHPLFPQTLTVSLNQNTSLQFGQFFATIPLWQTSTQASAGVNPVDLTLILADGSSLVPLNSAIGDSTNWPEAPQFQGINQYPNSYSSEGVHWWNSSEGRRWATQSCYNPVQNTFKSAALQLKSQLARTDSDRTSVIYSPGASGEFDLEVPLQLNSQAIQWNPLRFPNLYLGDEACALFSSTWSLQENPYNFSNPNLASYRSDSYSPYSMQTLSPVVSTEDILWWHSAKVGGIRRGNPWKAVRFIVNSPRNIAGTNTQLLRGTLKGEQAIVLLTDSLPLEEAYTDEQQLRSLGIHLSIIVYSHQLLTPNEKGELETSTQVLQAEIKQTDHSQAGIEIFLARSDDEVSRIVEQSIIPRHQKIMLRE
jgi:hypothetical protein